MITYLLDFTILNLAVLCYNMIYYYNLSDDKTNYSNNYIVYNNYNQLKFLIKTNIKLVLFKELLLRIYLVEIMKYIFNFNDLVIIWIIAFSSFTIIYHQFDNNINKINRLIKYFTNFYSGVINHFSIHFVYGTTVKFHN